jgi:transcriptional regulator with XRE-family HTH domain
MQMGERLKTLRAAKEETAQQVADAIGVTRSAVSLWETEQTVPTPDNILALSKHFEVSTDELMGNGGNEKPKEEEAEVG